MTRYYTLNPDTNDLERIVPPITIGGRPLLHLPPEQAAALDPPAYPRELDEEPTPPEGKVAVPDSWEVQDGEWVRTWRYEDAPPPPPRKWSRLTVKTALAQASLLSKALAYLAQVEIATGYSAAEALQDCDYIEEGYPTAERWGKILDGAAQALGKTRAEIDAFLDSLPTE